MKTRLIYLTMALCMLSLAAAHAQGTAAKPVKGSPYLDEAYVDAVISFATNTRKVPARYNAYKDLIEYQQNGTAMVLDPAPTIKEVKLGDETFVVEKYDADGTLKAGYFTLIDSGKVSLYSKKTVRYVPGRKNGALDGTDQPAEFKRAPDTFYFKVGDGAMQEIDNIKDMIAGLPDKQDELTKFAKKEKISPRDEDELRKLLKYYSEL